MARAVSHYRARVAVPSCNASGKTHLAGRIALAFYDAFTPGTPCVICDGPCGGSKVITTSSKFEHLKDNLWGEIRTTYPLIAERVGIPGRLFEGENLRLEDNPKHFIVGHNPKAAEGMQGYHAAHKLIIGDEATSLSEDMASGITGLLSSGDSRLFLIANPTTADTWFAQEAITAGTEMVRIQAWDTPLFTGEDVPQGAALITPEFLEYLKAHGMGPGSYEWTTRVEAKFWTLGEDSLIPEDWWDRNTNPPSPAGNVRQLGIDLASYGSSENVIAWREGDTLLKVDAFPSMRQDLFFAGPVTEAIKRFDPHIVCYDADGVGAGVAGEVERAAKYLRPQGQVIGFRGALKTAPQYHNARSAWWWALRKRFEANSIKVAINDPSCRSQATNIRYSITAAGAIRVETKEEMRKRGVSSPDRADGVMYAFAFSDELPMPLMTSGVNASVEAQLGLTDRGEDRMWRRDMEGLGHRDLLDPVWGTPLDW